MAWSGITKYIKSICQLKGKAVEFPHLGVFVPVFPESTPTMSNKITKRTLSYMATSKLEVNFYVNQSFLNTCGDCVRVSESNTQIGTFDPTDPESCVPNTEHLNLASICAVCDTDSFTIE